MRAPADADVAEPVVPPVVADRPTLDGVDLAADADVAEPVVPPVVADRPTLDAVDLAVGAPPEDLGQAVALPDDDVDDLVDADLVGPSSVSSGADELDAEDELLPAARNAKGRPPAKVGGNRVAVFLRASWAELQRVQWPDRRQVGQATAVVLGFVVIAGGYLGLADVVSQSIVDAIL